MAAAQLPAPLDYVQTLEPLEGKTLILKQVTCQAEGKPLTLGRLYVSRTDKGQYQASRIEYNEQGKYILDHGKTSPSVYKYYDKYVTRQQPFSLTTMNAIIGLWRFFGMRFSLEKVTYYCKMS
ncbi:hypothetical protein [Deinococcus xinjiangensis]